MIKDIKYNGHTAVPSDYECQDGELSECLNFVPEDGVLKPMFQPKAIFTFDKDAEIVFIHKTTSFTHYIIKKERDYYWIDKSTVDTNSLTRIEIGSMTIYQITSIGNTLIFLTNEGLQYFLWKDNAYSYLGSHLPELPISFGLQGSVIYSDSFDVNFIGNFDFQENVTELYIPEAEKTHVTNQVLAQVNKIIAEHYTNGHRFMYPFFVRYAYRLYDGTLTMHSAPILMICTSGQNPFVFGGYGTGNEVKWDRTKIPNCCVLGALYTLDFAVAGSGKYDYIEDLKKWSDIVTSVDIFISEPLYSYDQSGTCTMVELRNSANFGGRTDYCVCKKTVSILDAFESYRYHTMFDFIGSPGLNISIKLPQKKHLTQKENIRNASRFYFLKSYKIDELTTVRKPIDIEDGYLQSLNTRELMTDDYDSHSKIVAKMSFPYNNRLNLSGITKVMPKGFHMSSQLCFTDVFRFEGFDFVESRQQVAMFIYIKKDGKDIVVRSLDFTESLWGDFSRTEVGLNTPTPFLFYPDVDAYKAVLYWTGYNYDGTMAGSGKWEVFREIKLEPHPMLNGAFYFNDFEMPSGKAVENVNKGKDDISLCSISIPNKIYTSEVNNPFFFSPQGITTVGTGNIIAISAATKALSQGQFGQFPLYAFTDEGVWALEVSSTGTYSARQPVTLDVCNNPRSITQLENAVLFATDRGIMLISGSQTQCITEVLNSEGFFDIETLPGLSSLFSDGMTKIDCTFREFILQARIIYDYVNQRIILFHPNKDYAYVYSLKSKMWGMMKSKLTSSINSYPEALAMSSDREKNMLVDVSYSDEISTQALLVTRPFKLDARDALKTIDTVIQRGYFRKGSVKSILYGSRNLFDWHLVFSSKDHILRGFRGSPYKYFRIVLLCDLSKDESISGTTVQYTTRLLNRPR